MWTRTNIKEVLFAERSVGVTKQYGRREWFLFWFGLTASAFVFGETESRTCFN